MWPSASKLFQIVTSVHFYTLTIFLHVLGNKGGWSHIESINGCIWSALITLWQLLLWPLSPSSCASVNIDPITPRKQKYIAIFHQAAFFFLPMPSFFLIQRICEEKTICHRKRVLGKLGPGKLGPRHIVIAFFFDNITQYLSNKHTHRKSFRMD